MDIKGDMAGKFTCFCYSANNMYYKRVINSVNAYTQIINSANC